MNELIARIRQKLAYLQPYNSGHVIDSLYERRGVIAPYPYGVYMTHTEEEIAAFESRYQIRLPEDYRLFIKEIGSEGFNPGRVMYSPLVRMLTEKEASEFYTRMDDFYGRMDTITEEDIGEDDLWKEDAPILGQLHRPFPFREITTPEIVDRLSETSESPRSWWGSGYLPIIERETGGEYILIVTGEARGEIWYQENLRYFTPVFLIDGRAYRPFYGQHHKVPADAPRLPFTQWYELWLDDEIRKTQERWMREGREVPPLILE